MTISKIRLEVLKLALEQKLTPAGTLILADAYAEFIDGRLSIDSILKTMQARRPDLYEEMACIAIS